MHLRHVIIGIEEKLELTEQEEVLGADFLPDTREYHVLLSSLSKDNTP